MKKIWKILIGIGITVLFTSIVITAVGFIHFRNQTRLEKNIYTKEELYKSGETDWIEITNIDYFRWDRVYIFPAYTNCDYAVEILNAPLFKTQCEFEIPYSEGYSLFVFTRNGNIVRYTSVALPIDQISPDGFSKEEAFFGINDRGYLSWFGE